MWFYGKKIVWHNKNMKFIYLFFIIICLMINVHSSSKQTNFKLFGVWIFCAYSSGARIYNQTHWGKKKIIKTDYPWLEQCSSLFIIWSLDTDPSIDWLKNIHELAILSIGK